MVENSLRSFTLTPEEKEKIINKIAAELKQVIAIRFAFLHGSFTENRPFHDIDVAVYFTRQTPEDIRLDTCIELSTKLTGVLNIPVDIHQLNSASLSFCYYASQGRILFCRDREEVYQYKEKTWIMYMDFYPFLKQNLLDLLEV
ncbi:type VII toxin-antitoxin system MntA family adenylyltransferase antitoxin [Calderihabitans maritimus]|uniref:Nucleotidyltransferase n=1 Tax=Calderihabitans maritimus TaxID=1246530 RepID=A0A1Z5HP39_9FIRM|nr:nucleotidyltransferase domain-containing protein [Calderihabitans maritimus]GAW91293.1 nucleotidyltransferase [Calderihabitans maritimus]